MRQGLLPAALLLAAAGHAAAADPALPPVVVQSQPVGKWLDDVRAGVRLTAGPKQAEKAIQDFTAGLKAKLGDLGLDGIDLTKPIVGYAQVKAGGKLNQDDTVFIAAVPVTSEAAALALLKRAKCTVEPVAGKAGLFTVTPPPDAKPGGVPGQVRFHDGHAYIGDKAEEYLSDPAKLIPVDKLVVPGETGLLAVRVYFDRFPEATRQELADAIDNGLKSLDNAPFPPDMKAGAKEAAEQFVQLFRRYMKQSRETESVVGRLLFDPATGDAAVEVSVAGKPGSSLAADIAGRQPTVNRFAGLVGKDTVGGALLQLPLFAGELRNGLAVAIAAGGKEGLGSAPPAAKPLAEEVLAGLDRTLKGGQFDVAAVLAGPDAKGKYTATVALAFEDTKGLEREVKKLIDEQLPPNLKGLVGIDAAKADGVSIHTVTVPLDAAPPQLKGVFGDTASAALAFAPHGIYLTFGPDPVAAMKAALAHKPAPAKALDVVLNPGRVSKLLAAAGDDAAAARSAEVLGTDDAPVSAFSVAVEGGAALKLRIGVNLKLFPRAAATSAVMP